MKAIWLGATHWGPAPRQQTTDVKLKNSKKVFWGQKPTLPWVCQADPGFRIEDKERLKMETPTLVSFHCNKTQVKDIEGQKVV